MPNSQGWLASFAVGRKFWPILAIGMLLLSAYLLNGSVTLDVAATWMLAALLVIGWTTFCGPAQEVSLGHALFFGGAGYIAAILQIRAGAGPVVALIAAAAGAAALGCLLAL